MRAIEALAAEGRAKPARRPALPLEARVFTRDGEEVFVTQVCTKCGATKPLTQFGLRRMADGKIRSIAQCKACRSHPHGVPIEIVVDEERAREGGHAS